MNREFITRNGTLIATVIVLALIILIVLLAQGADRETSDKETPEVFLDEGISELANPGRYALGDIALHADRADCWTVIEGEVYDLTAWVEEYPDQTITSICGKDGTAQLRDQKEALASFKIGTLEN